jgi:uroporphyrinogen-III synthase
MMPLAGLGVLVTRPAHQADSLADQLQALGARVYRLPALDVIPTPDESAQLAALRFMPAIDWIVFVSANAARFGAYLLPRPGAPRIAAVGPATAAALSQMGHALALVPDSGFDSESLLACPELQAVVDQQILIVRGGSGRDILGETLKARGAHVRYVDVYSRVPATPLPSAINAIETAWAEGKINVVTVTSGDIARALYEILTPRGRALYTHTTLLTGSARIAESARAIGLQGPFVIASAPHDEGLVAALTQAARDGFQPNASA